MTYSGDSPIKGQGTVTAEQIDNWFAINGPNLAKTFAPDKTYRPAPAGLGQMIIDASRHWPEHTVNHDIVAADIAHESAFWQSRIVRDKNNPSGLGATNDDPYGGAVTFSTPQEGIRATVAHMLTYAVGEGPWRDSDPRYSAVESAGWLGSAQRLKDLNGKWAWPGTSYGQSIAAAANRLLETDAPMAGDDTRFQWTPDEHEFGYPTGSRGRNGKPILYLIIHTTEGTNSQDWLRDQHGSSTHYLTDRQFKPRAQHVRDADAAWTAGHAEYNLLGINIELEHKAGQAITPAMYRNAAETVKPVLDRHGIPPVYLGRDPLANKPGEKGIIGHGDVPAPNDHTDPTAPWNWDTFMAALLSLYGTPDGGDVEPREFETGFSIRGRIRDYWERAEEASVAYQGIGLPTSDEYDATHEGQPVVRQDFERVVLQYHPAAEFPWDVSALFRTDLPSDVKAQLADVQEKLEQIREIVTV